jgi:hypothetical protein
MFEMFERSGSSPADAKTAMLICGFPNVVTGRNPTDTLGDTARRERCMFLKGFRYIDGYRGICSTRAAKNISECLGDQ